MSTLKTVATVAGVMAVGGAIAHVALRTPDPALPPSPPVKPLLLPNDVVALETGSTNPTAPIVVTLHGIDGTEKQLVPYLTAPLFRYVHLRGLKKSGKNYQWFTARLSQSPALAFIDDAKKALEVLRPALAAVRAQRNPAELWVAGYSQGGHLAWLLAEAGLVDRALVAAGALPATYKPAQAKKRTKIHVVSGIKDRAVPWRPAVETTLRNFQSAGYEASAITVADAGHSLVTLGKYLNPGLSELVK